MYTDYVCRQGFCGGSTHSWGVLAAKLWPVLDGHRRTLTLPSPGGRGELLCSPGGRGGLFGGADVGDGDVADVLGAGLVADSLGLRALVDDVSEDRVGERAADEDRVLRVADDVGDDQPAGVA